MNTIGIIAEYNPFHIGHLHHIRASRAMAGEGAFVVVAMSGHVVQRGEFPIMTKYSRAKTAVRCGADLVFELPAVHACACAERFARAGVGLLSRLGVVTHLSFGAETGDVGRLQALSLLPGERRMKAQSLARAAPALNPEAAPFYTPNNILAIEYLRALRETGSQIAPLAVPREGGRHDDDTTSASAYRRRIRAGELPASGLPCADILEAELRAGRAPVDLSRLEPAILSRLRSLTAADLEALPEMSGGFHNRLFRAIRSATSLDGLCHLTKSKRFTMARVRRAILCAFLGISESDALAQPPPRLLAIGPRGPELLSRIRTPIISRPAARQTELALESAVTDQLCLAMPSPQPCGMEWTAGVLVSG